MSSPVPAQSDMITLGDIIHAVWQRKWLCISIVLAFFLVGLAVSVKKTPKYTFSQTLVNASVPPGYWNNDPRAMRVGPELASFLERHNDKVMQRNDDALDMKIGVAGSGSLSVTLKTEAPASRVNEVRSRLDDALKTLNDYQQPWLAITHQSLVRSVDLDQQAQIAESLITYPILSSQNTLLIHVLKPLLDQAQKLQDNPPSFPQYDVVPHKK